MAEYCRKHPKVELQIRRGKRNQHFVVCPECKPNLVATTEKTNLPAPAPAANEKKNDERKPTAGTVTLAWYDRKLFG